MADQSGPERLEALLGHNPSKDLTGGNILQEAMEEIKKERTVEAKKKAKELLTKAIELHQSITKADQEWCGKISKFNKELGKVLGSLDRFANGGAAPVQSCCEGEQSEPCCVETGGKWLGDGQKECPTEEE